MAKKAIPQKVRKTINSYLRILKDDGLRINQAYLFGSYAKGRQSKWSDIDLCIISPDLHKKTEPLNYLWSKKNDEHIDAILSPIGFSPKEFIDESPIVWEIKQTGIRIK